MGERPVDNGGALDDRPPLAWHDAAVEEPGVGAAEGERGDNVFVALRDQARSRSVAELWAAAITGTLNAGWLWWRHPVLSWVAAGCAAVAAYGAWGLLDRAALIREQADGRPAGMRASLVRLRACAAAAGTGAALWAVLGFMAFAFSNWKL